MAQTLFGSNATPSLPLLDANFTELYSGVLIGSGNPIGYAAGSGGSVTQATSKTTTVTLNKPNGLITMNAAALAAGATAAFNLSNSLIGNGDHVFANLNFGTNSYDVKVFFTSAGVCAIAVKNITAGSLSDAVTIDFVLIKGATT